MLGTRMYNAKSSWAGLYVTHLWQFSGIKTLKNSRRLHISSYKSQFESEKINFFEIQKNLYNANRV